jgi:hypothetical protein
MAYLLLPKIVYHLAPSMLIMQLELIAMRSEIQSLYLCLFTVDQELVEKKCHPVHLYALDALLGCRYDCRWYLVPPTLP